jgi:putative addiction module component (TIGR02574 family)
MSSRIMERLRDEALQLPEAERAELAHELVKSLDGGADASAAGAWETELLRRLQELDAGVAKTVDRKEFSRRIRERLNKL